MTAPVESSGTPVADRDRVAVILHDADCPDRCEPSTMGIYYMQADALFDAGLLVGPRCHRPETEVNPSGGEPSDADVRRWKAEALREAADLGYYNSAWLRGRADELEGR